LLFLLPLAPRAETISIVIASNAAPRVQFGAEKIVEALKAVKLDALVHTDKVSGRKIFWLDQPRPCRQESEGFEFDLRKLGVRCANGTLRFFKVPMIRAALRLFGVG
jgi:hypothetical protein